MKTRPIFLFAATAVLVCCPALPADTPPDRVDYTVHIKPIFTAHCRECHNGEKQESGFRIDTGRFAVTGGDRGPAIVAGKSHDSIMYQSLIGEGDVPQMPYERSPLSTEQIVLIQRWIDQGAKVPAGEIAEVSDKSDHWSFRPIQRPPIPATPTTHWAHNSIDPFVDRRLGKEGLAPSQAASPETLIRRVHLDLLGLLPSAADVTSFVTDNQPDVYQRMIDRVLASPRYGERWAQHWLDLARYADSNGFTIDSPRSIWKYRDWVIAALNQDMSFDQFSTEQLAGDLLPNATIDQIIATGFHRNTLVNQEGGTDDEQFRVEAVVDRVNTTGSVWLGLTVGCSQCHEHKYDPISQRDYYRLFAFFNTCQDNNDADGLAPKLPVPTSEQAALKQHLTTELVKVQKPLQTHDTELLKRLPDWEKEISTNASAHWSALDPLKWHSQEGAVLSKIVGEKQYAHALILDFTPTGNDTYTVVVESQLEKITAIRLEALTHINLPNKGPGRANSGNDDGNFILSEFKVSASPRSTVESMQPVNFSKAVADHSQEGYPIVHAIDGKPDTGWGINVTSGNLNVDREAIFILNKPVTNKDGTRLTFEFHHNHAVGKYLLGCFRISVTSTATEILTATPIVREIAALPAEQRTKQQQTQLEDAFKQTDPQRSPLAMKVAALLKQLETLNNQIPTTLVMQEQQQQPRTTHVFIRGDFLRKGAVVVPGIPAVLPQLPPDIPQPTRLDFARWLTHPDNPLTARVTVNLLWQRFFGKGIVATENDFGLQGAPPTHPELLDWLGSELVRRAWGVKAIQRLIVNSATYRQSSYVPPDLLEHDPANKLLARQSRLRLSAETIRDICLVAGDFLSDKMGGPSVYPPQPIGSKLLTQVKRAWPNSEGEDRFRRGMYTYFWRSSPHPFLMTFDAPDSTTTCTRRTRSNTPLQALTLANDEAFFEFAQGLALHILKTTSPSNDQRLSYAFQVCLSREPNDFEYDRLGKFVEQQQAYYESTPQEAASLAPSDLPDDIDVSEAAAWTATARVILNLDEFITRE